MHKCPPLNVYDSLELFNIQLTLVIKQQLFQTSCQSELCFEWHALGNIPPQHRPLNSCSRTRSFLCCHLWLMAIFHKPLLENNTHQTESRMLVGLVYQCTVNMCDARHIEHTYKDPIFCLHRTYIEQWKITLIICGSMYTPSTCCSRCRPSYRYWCAWHVHSVRVVLAATIYRSTKDNRTVTT